MAEACVAAIEFNRAVVWIAEGDADTKFPWPWLQSRLGLDYGASAAVYCSKFDALEGDLMRFGQLAQQWTRNRKIPFIVVSHRSPTVLAPDFALIGVGEKYKNADYQWYTRNGQTLELAPGVSTNCEAPAHIVLDLRDRDAIRFSWDGIDRIQLDQ